MLRRRTGGLGLIGAILLLGGAARADHNPFLRSFDAVPVHPTPSLASGIALESASALPAKSWRAAFLLDANVGIMSLRLGGEKVGDLLPFRLDGHILFSYQLLSWLELGGDFAFTAFQANNFQLLADRGFPETPPAAAGLMDLRFVPKATLLRQSQVGIDLAAVAEVRFPIGDGSAFLGDRAVVFAPRGVIERRFGDFRLLGSLGMRLRAHSQYLNLFVGQEVTFGLGGIYRIGEMGLFKNVDAIGETHLATPWEAPFNFAQADALKTPWELLVGMRGKVHGRWGVELNLGRGIGFEGGYGRETFRVMAALRYDVEFADQDGDGIADEDDQCPTIPEDKDGFQDADGCPDPDNDQDGVLDKEDECPNQAGLPALKGCPDRDGDGVPDHQDACPDAAGPKEFDGCPDTDQDDVPDNVDKCPDQPGPAENEGCPIPEANTVVLESDRIRLRGNILFETGSAQIQAQSYPLLNEVYQVLKKNPDIGPVLIEGHTDNRGGRAYNLDLSERRARSVLEYIARKGIDKSRLRSQGFGYERPVAANATPLGQAKNRRVEFRLVKDAAPLPGMTPGGAPAAEPAKKP